MLKLNHKIYESPIKDKTLFILHGLLGSLDNWHTYASNMSAYMRVIAVDQRNHGRSPRSDEMNYKVMAEDLKLLVEEYRPTGQIFLLGHSMGGKTVMTFAQLFPELLDKLIVVDIAPKRYEVGYHKFILETLKRVPLDGIKRRSEADKYLQPYIPNFAIRQFLLKGLIWNQQENKFEWKTNLDVIMKEYKNILEGVPFVRPFLKPTLFVKGNKSDYIKDEDIPIIKKYFPNAKIVGIDNAGHWVHAEAFREFFNITKDFLLEY